MISPENRLNPQASRLSPEPFGEGLDCWALSWSGRWHRLVHPAEVLALFRSVKTMDRTAPSDWQAVEFFHDGAMRKRFTFARRSFASREQGGSVVQTFGGSTTFDCLSAPFAPGFVRPKPAAAAQPTAPAERLDISRRPPAPIGVPGHRRGRL